jgi:hypothetical protein
MGLTHAEFFRSLPPAVGRHAYSVEDGVVRIDVDGRQVIIELGPQRSRAIASLELPYLKARFNFHGFSDEERERFMERFELYFRRGGG